MRKLMMECSLMDALQYGVKSDLASFQARTIIWVGQKEWRAPPTHLSACHSVSETVQVNRSRAHWTVYRLGTSMPSLHVATREEEDGDPNLAERFDHALPSASLPH